MAKVIPPAMVPFKEPKYYNTVYTLYRPSKEQMRDSSAAEQRPVKAKVEGSNPSPVAKYDFGPFFEGMDWAARARQVQRETIAAIAFESFLGRSLKPWWTHKQLPEHTESCPLKDTLTARELNECVRILEAHNGEPYIEVDPIYRNDFFDTQNKASERFEEDIEDIESPHIVITPKHRSRLMKFWRATMGRYLKG